MEAREQFLSAVSAEELDVFIAITKKNGTGRDDIDISEVISSLDKKQLSEVWQQLQMKCTRVLLNFDVDGEDEHQAKELEEASKVLQGIVVVAMATIKCGTPVIVGEMKETVIVLHGILTSLPETETKLAVAIARLCETWWLKQLDGYMHIADQTLTWLLQRSCDGKATQADIKRVYSLRQCLTFVDLEKPSSATLNALLLASVGSINYLKSDEGRHFIVYLFTLREAFVEDLHKTVKNHLPVCKKSLLEYYGEIYFRVWRDAKSPIKEKVAEYCIQDLMYHAVHAPRGSSKSLSSILLTVLQYIHRQKKHPGVDQLLLSLYEPILWRSLKVANTHVRANAAALLVDVFPLHDPGARAEEQDNLNQKQIDALQTLLYDPSATVRAIVVKGVCSIIGRFWEFLPTATIAWFVNRLITELAWDGSSPEVRAGVLQGMGLILDNDLSHTMLKVLLPELRNLLHDVSEMVRVAFVELLQKVRGMSTIKYWSIAPVEHLLARLEIESDVVARRIISLVFSSFLPVDKPMDVQLDRCITILQSNPGAARKFYRYAPEKMSTANTASFMTAVCRCVLACVRRAAGEQDVLEQDEEQEKENVDEEDGSELSANDAPLMAGLLETVVILWQVIDAKLSKPGNADVKECLVLRFSQALPEFYRAFSDPRITACLTLLASFLPPNNIPIMSRSTLSALRSMDEESEASTYVTMLEAMCKWGKISDITELITDWLEATLIVEEDEENPAEKSRKTSGVRFAEPVVPRPRMALVYLQHLIQDAVCREVLLTSHKNKLADIAAVLSKVPHCIERRLKSDEQLNEHATDEVLLEAFEIYCKLEILLHDPEKKEHSAVTVMENLLTWADAELLIYLRRKKVSRRKLLNHTEMTLLAEPGSNATLSTTMLGTTLNQTLSTTIGGSKRTAGEAYSPAVVELSSKIISSLLSIFRNMLLVGVGDQELLSHLQEFSSALLKADESMQFIKQISEMLYQITELSLTWEQEVCEDEGVGSHGNVVAALLTKMIQVLSSLARNKKEQAERVLPAVKPAFSQILQAYYRHHNPATSKSDLMATILTAVHADMAAAIREEPEFEKREKVSELPHLTAFILSAMGRRKNINCAFAEELRTNVESGSADDMESTLAFLHLVHALGRGLSAGSGIKECMTALQLKVDGLEVPQDTAENSPYRVMHTNVKQMSKDCLDRLGMVP